MHYRLATLGAMLAMSMACASWAAENVMTVADLARYARIGDQDRFIAPPVFPHESSVATFSPDGEYVAVLIRSGDPDELGNEGRLLVYRSGTLLRDAAPVEVAHFSSKTNAAPIGKVRWLDDSRTLVFAATDTEESAVYRVNVESRDLLKLTRETSQLMDYDVTASGDHLVVRTQTRALLPAQNPECQRRGCLVRGNSLYMAEWDYLAWKTDLVLYDLAANERKVIDIDFEDRYPDLDVCTRQILGGLSPDGRYAMVECHLLPGHWPQWWAEYTFDADFQSAVQRGDVALNALHLMLIDFETGEARRLSSAPWMAFQPPPVWIDGGRRFIAVNAVEPLADTSGAVREARAATPGIFIVDPESGEMERIASVNEKIWWTHPAPNVRWEQRSQTLTVGDTTYQRRARKWVKGKAVTSVRELPPAAVISPDGTVALSIEQGLNDRPRLVASSMRTGRKKELLDPNPWLAKRRLGRVEAVTWKARDGRDWRGAIYYPPDYTPGRRYPLLIQTHGFLDKTFDPYGVTSNFVAQPVAAHDIIVLQVAESLKGIMGSPEEWPAVQAGYEAAIDHMDSKGLIDRSRVGMTGWSRTGPHVSYTLTFSSYPIAAAAFTSTGLETFWFYLNMGPGNASDSMHSDFGAAPFGDGLDVWRKLSPGFNMDRVKTPTFMWEEGTISGLWDWYSGLRRFKVPVEYWYLPDGEHETYKIGEQMQMGQLLVDWFRFWLKDEEDAAAEKVHQYQRWRKMRSQWQDGAARQ